MLELSVIDLIAGGAPQGRVTLATGGWIHGPLLAHVAAGGLAILSGFVALSAAKGAETHRRSGRLFVYTMLVMALVGAAIAAYEGKAGSVDGGLLTAYLVVTALLTVRPATRASRRVGAVAMVVAFGVGAVNLALGLDSVSRGAATRDGVPVPMYIVFGGIALACALSDIRVLRAGGLRGAPRLARHLWRMCFALFIAAGSFFLGQARLIPAPYRNYTLLAIPALIPLVVMAYWFWRIRVRRRLRGLVVGRAPETRLA